MSGLLTGLLLNSKECLSEENAPEPAITEIVTEQVIENEERPAGDKEDMSRDITPEEIAPEPSVIEPVIENEEQPATDETEISREKILVREFSVEGATLIDAETIKSITAPYEGRELTLQEISAVANAITAAYRSMGYIIAYAFVPPQDVNNEAVIIRVLEGRIGNIAVSGNTHYSSNFIKGHIEQTRKDASLKEKSLERALLILNEYPSLVVRATLRAGMEAGTADIIADAADSRHRSGTVTYDNFGSDVLSKHRMVIEFDAGSLAADGDLLTLRGVTGLDRIDIERLAYGRIEYTAPVDHNGTKLGVYGANSIYEAGKSLAPLQIRGKGYVAGIYLTHLMKKQKDQSLTIKAGFDYKNINDYILDDLNSKDNIRSLNIGINYDFIDRHRGRNIATFTWYQGMSGFFGGAGKNEAGTSRPGADGSFSRFTLDLMRLQEINNNNKFILSASGQASGVELFSAEQFSIGGMGTVRGFKPSLHSGDSGYALTAELHTSPLSPEKRIFKQKLNETIKFVLFADHAGVYRHKTQPGEDKNDHLTSIGAGIRLYAGRRFTAMMDWAVPEIDRNCKVNNAETYLQIVMSF